MDYILLAICAFYFLRGYFKGFFTMLFSLVGTFFIVILAWKLSESILPFMETWMGNGLLQVLKTNIDKLVTGSFSNLSQLEAAVAGSKLSIFGIFLFKLLPDLSFDGSLSAGQILAPSISTLLIKVIAFLVLFFALFLALKLLRLIINKIVKTCGLSFANRIFGGLIGLAKGLVLFGIVFFALSSLANLLLNESLLAFVQGGAISNWLYENLIVQFVDIFY